MIVLELNIAVVCDYQKAILEEAVLLLNRTLPDIVTLELIALMEEILFFVKLQSLIIRIEL